MIRDIRLQLGITIAGRLEFGTRDAEWGVRNGFSLAYPSGFLWSVSDPRVIRHVSRIIPPGGCREIIARIGDPTGTLRIRYRRAFRLFEDERRIGDLCAEGLQGVLGKSLFEYVRSREVVPVGVYVITKTGGDV